MMRGLMEERISLMIVAGEASGDAHAASLVRALHKIKAVPIICTTGEGSAARRLGMEEAGVRNFLNKPYSAEQIVTLVSDVLREFSSSS